MIKNTTYMQTKITFMLYIQYIHMINNTTFAFKSDIKKSTAKSAKILHAAVEHVDY